MDQAVLVAFVLGTPVLLSFLGVVGLSRDRFSSLVMLAVAGVFAAVAVYAAFGPQVPEIAPRPSPVVGGLLAGAGLALALRLRRDRRQGHIRSTCESLAVLGCGAILVATLVSLPTILAELARRAAI